MSQKNLCTIDSRVKNQYVYSPEKERWQSVELAQVMREMHDFRVSHGHEPNPDKNRPIYAYEIKARAIQ